MCQSEDRMASSFPCPVREHSCTRHDAICSYRARTSYNLLSRLCERRRQWRPLSQPTPCRPTSIRTTAPLSFMVCLDAEGVMGVRLVG